MSYQVAYVSTYPPQKCGIATYTYHLRQNVQKAKEDTLQDPVVVIAEHVSQHVHSPSSNWNIIKDRPGDYAATAEKLNQSPVSVVSLQHEFGIFGGEAGNDILEFVRHLKKPLITTFHTVFEHPKEPYASIQREIAKRSEKIIVMNRKAVDYLTHAFDIPKSRVIFIPHGTPVPNPEKRTAFRQALGWTDRKIMMTFGFLGRSKGIEAVLNALPGVVEKVPDILYVIIGQTHPNVKRAEGESYRDYLKSIIRDKNLQKHVLMIDQFMSEQDLVKYITSCDLYVTPYPGLEQITSGTLAYAVGLGRPVLTTPYRYAQDLLKGHEDLFVPFSDTAAWTRKIISLLIDSVNLHDCQRKVKQIGLPMSWPHVGKRYDRLFEQLAGRKMTLGLTSLEAEDIATSTN